MREAAMSGFETHGRRVTHEGRRFQIRSADSGRGNRREPLSPAAGIPALPESLMPVAS